MNTRKIGLVLLIVCALLLTACADDTKEISLVKPKIEQTLGSLPALEEAEMVFNVKDNVFGKTLAIYKKTDDKKEVLNKVKDRLGFKDGTENSNGGIKQYKNDSGGFLMVYETGSFEYTLMNPGRGITISEEQMEEMAKQKLEEFGISLEGFVVIGTYDAKSNGKIYSQTLCYERKVDGYDIVGSSEITVGFADDEIYSFGLLYSGREKAFCIECKGKDYVKENFIKDTLDINIKNDAVRSLKIKQIEVTGAEIVYLDVHYDQEQPHIQPLYRFSGKLIAEDGTESDFESLMSAVPDQYFTLD